MVSANVYTGYRLERANRCKGNCSLQVGVVVTILFNIAVNYFDAKESARCSRVLNVTELV